MNIVSKRIGIHTLTVLIDAETQATAYFLTLANVAAGLLQRADLEYIWVIPTFTKCGMRKYKSNRRLLWISIKKKLFVFHNKVVGINVI